MVTTKIKLIILLIKERKKKKEKRKRKKCNCDSFCQGQISYNPITMTNVEKLIQKLITKTN